MSRAYTAARVEMIEQPEPPQARQEEDVPILFLHDIERHYRQGDETLHVLNGIELALWGGQSVALVAPSGAGKSTLLHIAGLLEHPDHGDVYIEGRATAILWPITSEPASAATKSGSSISLTICCRNSRRLKTCSCRR